MKIKFDVTAQELKIIRQILQQHLPARCKVWVFGSRAKNQAKFNSDLDLAIECEQPLDKRTSMQLEMAFDEAPLPYRVDIVDMQKVDPGFKGIIDKQKVVFPIQSNVPELRFKGFFEEWKSVSLGEISSQAEYGLNTPAVDFDGVRKYIRITDIDDKTHQYSPNPVTSPMGNVDDSYKLKEGDLLFTRTGASTGKSYLYTSKDGNLYFAGFLIRFHIDGAFPGFVFFQTLRSSFSKWIKIESIRSGQPGINAKEYSSFRFYCPSEEEQKKIATFLSSIDDKLNSLRRKRELLETYKRGLMQKVFSQEIRFKKDDGTDFSDWKRVQIGSQLEEVSRRVDAKTTLPVYSSTREGLKPQSEYYNDRELANDGEYGVVPVGCFVYRHMSDDLTFKFNVNKTDGDIAVSKEYPVFKAVGMENDFLLNKLNNSIEFKRFAAIQKKGGTRTRLYYKTLCSWKTEIPILEEQQKISVFLAVFDKKIKSTSKQINQLETFKKGLLQKMFV
ncbi:restriction endonuclease subunit S [Marinobacterium sp. D7]|uniref:restriction endonuclease subunit S n=1 Tax=Marinobacterium ramblicola TaxID=2849041 RepID=UPI001C2D81D6|nr:restriction endonuclease subunit S [Marinobacterium ramblicola]MBV1788443.1 restriction endonuclease subunit S [Marinobacterium ramblicola]